MGMLVLDDNIKAVQMNTPSKARPNANLLVAGTSGKKIRRVEVQDYAISRNEREVVKHFTPMVVLVQSEQERRSGGMVRHSHQDRVAQTIHKQRGCEALIEKRTQENQMLLKRIEEMKGQLQRRRVLMVQREKVLRQLQQQRRKSKDKAGSKSRMKGQLVVQLSGLKSDFALEINKKEIEFQNKKFSLNEAIRELEKTNSQRREVAEVEGRSRQLIFRLSDDLQVETSQHNFRNKYVEEARGKIAQGTLEVAVLNMQIKPDLRLFFELHNHDREGYKQILLNDSGFRWNKKLKNRPMAREELKYFIVIRLYRGWRKILKEWCCNFRGFNQLLFCQSAKKNTKMILSHFMPSKQEEEGNRYRARWTARKKLHYLVIHAQQEAKYREFVDTIKELEGLDNGIIHITGVEMEVAEEPEELLVNIVYDYMGEKRSKEFVIVRLMQASRETVAKYLASDKVTLLKVEAPMVFDSAAEKIKYEEVYEMLKRASK